MTEIKISLELFGAFRKFGKTIDFVVERGSSITMIKKALVGICGKQDEGLILDSVLADGEKILSSHDVVVQDTTLTILPPVCGG